MAKALDYLSQVEVSVQGADEETEEGRRIVEEARRRIAERVRKFLEELRLGEGGAVCLAGCQFGEYALTYKHEPYARFAAPFIHYIAEDAPREEVVKFVAELVLYDGSVSIKDALLTMGNFRVEDQTKALPLDVYDKLALFIIFAAKYGVGVKEVYIQTSGSTDAAKKAGLATIYFDRGYAAEAFAEAWAGLHAGWRFGREQGLYADHLFKKTQKLRRYVEEYVKSIRIEHIIRGDKATVYFRDEAGNEIAHINIRWNGRSLLAYFNGARKTAERLTAVLNALGASAEAREDGARQSVKLYTDSITAIRHPDWLNAVRALVEELYKNGKIDEKQRDKLLREIEAGPNVVEVAGVELGVRLDVEIESGKSKKKLVIKYNQSSPDAHEAAVKALKAAGFEEGIHFTAKRPEGGQQGYVRLKMPAGLWKLEELERQGVEWAKKALKRLGEIARARGFYDLLEEHLKPAREAETVDPRDVVVEDRERGVRAVIKDVKLGWVNGRPRITIEYEAGGRRESFYFTWGVRESGAVYVNVALDGKRALVLAALTGDDSLKGRTGSATLTAKHLFALARYKGIGWDLLRWYAKVKHE